MDLADCLSSNAALPPSGTGKQEPSIWKCGTDPFSGAYAAFYFILLGVDKDMDATAVGIFR